MMLFTKIKLALLFLALMLPSAYSLADITPIERGFDRNKGALYALYARELRTHPRLRGKIVFEIGIAADGNVTSCQVRSSQLHHPDLETKLCARIKMIQFGPLPAAQTLVKPIDFFSAAG